MYIAWAKKSATPLHNMQHQPTAEYNTPAKVFAALIFFSFFVSVRPINIGDVQGIRYPKPPKMKPLRATKLQKRASH